MLTHSTRNSVLAEIKLDEVTSEGTTIKLGDDGGIITAKEVSDEEEQTPEEEEEEEEIDESQLGRLCQFVLFFVSCQFTDFVC